jgi:hypothetical protein
MRSKIVEKILINMPLETEINVSNQMAFIALIHELGFRENKFWNENDEKDNELLNKIHKFALEHSKNQLETIEKFIDDDRPFYSDKNAERVYKLNKEQKNKYRHPLTCGGSNLKNVNVNNHMKKEEMEKLLITVLKMKEY